MFHLRSLVLRSTDVTDDGLYEIGLGCRKLEQVFLENCKKIGAQGVVDLISNCVNIRALKVRRLLVLMTFVSLGWRFNCEASHSYTRSWLAARSCATIRCTP